MIRVPSIAIPKPWPQLLAPRRSTTPAGGITKAEEELARKHLHATVERERTVAFSAYLDGRPIP